MNRVLFSMYARYMHVWGPFCIFLVRGYIDSGPNWNMPRCYLMYLGICMCSIYACHIWLLDQVFTKWKWEHRSGRINSAGSCFLKT